VTLAYPEELRDRARALVRDVGPLATVSAIGFVDANEQQIERALGAVEQASGWSYLDLRSGTAEQAQASLRRVLPEAAVLIVASTAKPPRPLIDAVRAYVDRHEEIDLGDHRKIPRRPDASLVLLCAGAANIELADRELRRIPYWDFVP
jgi:hypothetical protein